MDTSSLFRVALVLPILFGGLLVTPSQGQTPPPACPQSGVTTTFNVRDTDEQTAKPPWIATHALEIDATAVTAITSPWDINMDDVSVSPGEMTGVHDDYTPMLPGPQLFTIHWVQTRPTGTYDDNGEPILERCQGTEPHTLQIHPAHSASVGKPHRFAPRSTWIVGRSELFEMPFHTDRSAPDNTPVIVTLRARRGTKIPTSGPSSQMQFTFHNESSGGTHGQASMNGVRVTFAFGVLQVVTWKNPGPANGVSIDITQGRRHLRTVGLKLYCSNRIAAVYACVFSLSKP